CRAGAGARVARDLRRGELFGDAAHAGDRDSDGAGRVGRECAVLHPAADADARVEWGVDWDRGVDGSREIDGVAAVRREAWRYRDIRWNANRADPGGGGGGVCTCVACGAGRTDVRGAGGGGWRI